MEGLPLNNLMKNPFRISFESLEEFVEVVSEKLQCPITIEDANHRLIAYSAHDERTDPARISTIIGRRVPEKVINQLWKEGTIPALLKTKEPIRVKNMNEIGLGDRVAISIWKQAEVIGFIWALEIDKNLNEAEMLLLKLAADAAKNELLKLQVRKRKNDDRSQELFWQLLTGHFKEPEEINESFNELKINPTPSFIVMVFQFKEKITKKLEQQFSYLLKTSQEMKTILYTIDYNQMIVLVSAPKGDQPFNELDHFIKTFMWKLHDRYHITDVQPGVSSIYNDYQKIKKAYQEALKVLSMKEKLPFETQNIYCYQKLGIYQLFDCLLEKYKNEGYEDHSLQKLHLYDQKNHCNLVETLEVYLDKDTNIPEAAKELVVHPNTLTYRLKRITEIGEIDFKDPSQKMMLYLGIKLRKYLCQ